jgi:Uncharacterised nucleotidyltransferase
MNALQPRTVAAASMPPVAGGHARSLGRVVAAALAGTWRRPPAPLEIPPDELDAIAPLLLAGGVGPLVYWRLRQGGYPRSAGAVELQRAYVREAAQAVRHQHDIKAVMALLRSAGVDPILVKGWAIARLYPETGLRPYSDIDLCVRPDQHAAAERVLKGAEGSAYPVDLHLGFDHLDDRTWDELNSRSQIVRLGDQDVRVLGLEDHIHILCVHLLRHGAWRPSWLCDIAVAVESRAADFDWDRCLGPDPLRADWVACTIGVTQPLLGVRLEDTPLAARVKRLPRWLAPAVLCRWDWCSAPEQYGVVLNALAGQVLKPAGLLDEIRFRCDHPIRATIHFKGAFDDSSRLRFVVALAVVQLPELGRQALRWLGRRRP